MEMLSFAAHKSILGAGTNPGTYGWDAWLDEERAVCSRTYVATRREQVQDHTALGLKVTRLSCVIYRDWWGEVCLCFKNLSASYKYLWESGPALTPPPPHSTRHVVPVCTDVRTSAQHAMCACLCM